MTKEARALGAGPAFPTNGELGDRGLSVRDYFAAAALQGLVVSDKVLRLDVVAKLAREAADALLEELAK